MFDSTGKSDSDALSVSQGGRSLFLKIMLMLSLLLLSLNSPAPGLSVAEIFISKPVDAYERLISAVVMVESSGNNFALNIVEEAYGAFQIRPIRLKDYYRRTGISYTTEDCYNYEISKEIFLYYARLIGCRDYQTIARNWNGSGSMTLVYWEKVSKHL